MNEDVYSGRHLSKKDAVLVMGALDAITASKGALTTTETAKEMIRRARPEDSPTHHLFTWDDRAAGDAYRLNEARNHIRCVYVVLSEYPERKPIRAVVNVIHNGKRGPVPLRRVLQSADLMRQHLEKALEDLRIWTSRYEDLRALANLKHVFVAIDRVTAVVAPRRTAKKRPSRKRSSRSTRTSARA
jgi:hypothetical protein